MVERLLYLLGPLSCAVMMAAMLWMMRGHRTGQSAAAPDPTTQAEVAALRAEVAALRAARPEPADQPQPTVR